MRSSIRTKHLALYIGLLLLIAGCARMGSPDGGWYDDMPPLVIGASPADGGTDVKARRISIYFNEFIKLEDAQNKVIVSPPQIEMPDIKAAGKRIVVELKDTLKENTTYTVDFSDAITDNNEGNPMGNYTYSFSTGNQIDTFQVSGYALNAENLEPIKGILVGLYPYVSDEERTVPDTVFRTQPMLRVSRTNGSGFFTIKGVAPGEYEARALQDADGDFVYKQKSEMIGFSHERITPTSKPDVRQDTVWRDSLHIDNILRIGYTHFLPDDVTLLCFQVPQTDRYLIKNERLQPEKIGLFFSYGHDSLPSLRGMNFAADSAFVVEASQKRDTIYYWLRDTALVNQDTLRIEATYMMSDSTGALFEKVDTIEALSKVPYAKRMKEQAKELEKWQKEQEKKKKRDEPYDSIRPQESLTFKMSVGGQMDPNQQVLFEMPAPLLRCDTAGVHLQSVVDSVGYDEPHSFEQLSTRTYVLRAKWQAGMEYRLEIDSAAFQSIYGLVSKPTKQTLKVRKEEEFGMLAVNIAGVADTVPVVVQLLDASDKVLRQARCEDRTAEFYYVKPASYYLRAFEDWNDNGKWDTGDYDLDLQAEPVYYHQEPVECKANVDVSRDWQVKARPRYQQKPAAITKQKPDKEKQLRNRNAQRAAEKGIQYIQGVTGVKLK